MEKKARGGEGGREKEEREGRRERKNTVYENSGFSEFWLGTVIILN